MSNEQIKPQRSITEESGGIISKYQRRVVGCKSILYFIKYELIVTLFTNIPGALGSFLRSILFRSLFKNCGKGVQFAKGMTIRGPKKIKIGKSTIFDAFVVLDTKSDYDPGISFGEKCLISRNTKISSGYTGFVKINNQTIIGENCIIHGPGGITIGNNVLISDGVMLNAGTHVYSNKDKNILSQGITTKGIQIGDDCWLGAGALITDGVTIGKGSVIEAGSVVRESVPEYSIVSGVPARIVGRRK